MKPSGLRFLLLLAAAATLDTAHAQDGMTDVRRQLVVNEHNRLRRTVSATAMIKMEYDMKLECVAKKFAESSGTFTGHNANRVTDYAACGGSGYVGENWFSGQVEDASYYWVDFEWPTSWGFNGCSERQNYRYDTNDANVNANPPTGATDFSRCTGGTTGHFTQVLWAGSYKVGCWYTATFGTVCNYAPGGNYNGQPYVEYGTPCSKCPTGFTVCDNGLCAKPAGATSTATTTTTKSTTQPPTTTTETTTAPATDCTPATATQTVTVTTTTPTVCPPAQTKTITTTLTPKAQTVFVTLTTIRPAVTLTSTFTSRTTIARTTRTTTVKVTSCTATRRLRRYADSKPTATPDSAADVVRAEGVQSGISKGRVHAAGLDGQPQVVYTVDDNPPEVYMVA